MRRTIGKTITNPNNLHLTHVIKSSSSFSTSSGGGRGRGRGGGVGGGPVPFDFTKTPGKPDSDESKPESTESRPSGLGHGRGKPIASDPILPSFSSFVSSIKPSQPGTGRGRVTTGSEPSRPVTELPQPQPPPPTPPKKPIFVKIQELSEVTKLPTESTESSESNLPSTIFSALSGAGRGKPTKQSTPTPQIEEENRHVRARPRAGPREGAGGPAKPKLSREEAVKNAMMALSRGGDGEEGGGGGGGGRGRGRGGRGGRGMQKGWWREGGERRGRGRGGRGQDSEESYGAGLYLGDNADGEKLAKKLGPEIMNKLVEGFEEMSGNVLPSPMEDVYLDALHTNFSVSVL